MHHEHAAMHEYTLLKKLKEHFENTSDLNGGKNHAGYLYWYGLVNVLGTKGCHIV